MDAEIDSTSFWQICVMSEILYHMHISELIVHYRK